MKRAAIHSFRTSLFVLFLLLVVGAGTFLDAQTRVVTFTTESAVMLRWIDPDDANSEGYYVYRSTPAGEWNRLTDAPLTKVTAEKEIERVAGFKTDLYLGLLGATEPRDLTQADYSNALRGENAPFLRLMLLTNPEFGVLMGQRFSDSSVELGLSVKYKITSIVNGTERDVIVTPSIQTGVLQSVPATEGINGEAGNRSATITWQRDQSTLDAGSVVGYNVYRAESPLGPFEQMNTLEISPISIRTERSSEAEKNRGQYVDKWLKNGTPYYYQIRSVNIFGIKSAPSPTIEVIPRNREEPLPPSGLSLVQSGDHLELSWSASLQTSLGIDIYRSTKRNAEFRRVFSMPALPDIEPDSTSSWIDSDVLQGNEYFYFAVATNQSGLRSVSSDTLSHLIEDKSPPAPPANVQATSAANGITIKWDANTEADLLGYEVERASDDAYSAQALLTGAPVSETVWRDDVAKTSETRYGYVVYAVDKNYNRSARSRMVFARMPDIVPPQSPIITTLTTENDAIKLNWTASTERDIARYVVYRSSGDKGLIKVGQSNGKETSFEETPDVDGTYQYAVSAVDAAGNESEHSPAVTITYEKDRRIAPPSYVLAEEARNHIVVTWGPVDRAAGYVVYRVDPETNRSLLLAEPTATETEFKDWHSDRTKEVIYHVQARDSEWKMSIEAEGRYSPK